MFIQHVRDLVANFREIRDDAAPPRKLNMELTGEVQVKVAHATVESAW